jgi:hypothetical protein
MTWTLGDERAAPVARGAREMNDKMKAAIAAQKFEDLRPMFDGSFVQHSPFRADGPDGIIDYMKANMGAGFEYQPIVEMFDGPFTGNGHQQLK